MKALKISTTGEETELEDTDLKTLQDGVGGYIEAIHLDSITMWVNEDGIALKLPLNPRAQELWERAVPGWPHHGHLVGDVVLTGATDEEGEIIPLTRELMKRL